MATAKAYGSITIVDIGDLGTLSVCPESNQPLSVIYDPNDNGGTYNPNWATNNLTLTPVIYYGGTQISATNANVTVVWKRKVGSGSETDIASDNGESMDSSSKILTVNSNVLNSDNRIITYTCEVSYIEPLSGSTLTAKGQIGFSLICQPTTIKSCSIVGENVFLYDKDNALVGAEEITLIAKLDNCSISNWQYRMSDGTFADITGATSTTLTIKADSDYFINDMAIFRLNTNVSGVYDLHTITKIRDGSPGDSVISVVLSNEDMWIPCDSDGNVNSGVFDDNNVTTRIYVYCGSDNVTDEATISVSASGATLSSTVTNHTYIVTGMDDGVQTAAITFTVTYDGVTTNKIFNLTKLKSGADGVTPTIYSLEPSTLTINKSAAGIYTPFGVIFNAYSKTGNSNKTSYSGRIKIYADDNLVYNDENDVTSASFSFGAGTTYSLIKAELYASGGTTTQLDSQTVTVISDGAKGDDGDGGISFVLGNYADVIPCNEDGTVAAQYIIKIPFTAYQGIQQIACTAQCGSLPSGMSVSYSDGTSSAYGNIIITVDANATLGGTTALFNTGMITITLTANGLKSTQFYTWTKNLKAASGNDAVILQAYAPNGNIVNNGENDVVLSAILVAGSNTVDATSYQWYVFDHSNGTYGAINDAHGGYSGATTKTLTVAARAVSSYASFRVDATYKDTTYSAYISVQDKTDPLQVEVFSTLGDKITNSVGVGCVYARVFQNGDELDALQNLTISETAPASPLTSDVWAHILQSSQEIKLKKYDGSAWIEYAPDYTCTYSWNFGDYNGNTTTLGALSNSTAKFLYIDGSLINKKIQLNLTVEKS